MFKKEVVIKALEQWLEYNQTALEQLKNIGQDRIDVVQITLMNVISNVRFISDLNGEMNEFDEELTAFKPTEETPTGIKEYGIKVCEFAIDRHKRYLEAYKA